jgi:hypothetical protein
MADIINELPKKKGRPRKIKEEQETEEPVEKKKRGRKKKEDVGVVVEEKKKKKRGRKATVKYFSSSIRKKMPLTTTVKDQNDFILHLDIDANELDSTTEVTFDMSKNDERIYEISEIEKKIFDDDKYTNLEEDLNTLYNTHVNNRDIQERKIKRDLKNIVYEETNKKNKKDSKNLGYFKILGVLENENWLEKVDCCCWWCCHTFDTVPLGLPVYYNRKLNKFRVKGLFCSFACMTMYNDNCRVTKNENNCMIKQLYTILTESKLSSSIKRAPLRECLQMFGGDLTIEEFRENFNESKLYKKIEYPMYISRDYIEEVDIKNTKDVNVNIFKDIFQTSNTDSLKQINDAKRRLQTQIDKTTVTKNTIDKFINFN